MTNARKLMRALNQEKLTVRPGLDWYVFDRMVEESSDLKLR